MSHEVIVPKLGLTMEEGTVIEWHRGDGEAVRRGQPLFTIETDKVAYEVAAEADGWLERLVDTDVTLPVGAVVGRLHAQPMGASTPGATAEIAAGSAPGPTPAPASPPANAPVATPARAALPVAPPVPAPAHPAALSGPGPADGTRILASPIARRLAAERGIDLASLVGSGPGGVVLMRDVESVSTRPAALGAGRRRPLAGMRRTISQRMTASLAGSAQMTAFARVDMGEAERLRARLVGDAQVLGARITVTDLVLKCTALALVEFPSIREWIDGNEIVQPDTVDIGLAVALDDGLVVPVLRDVDRCSLVELSLARQALVERARAGRLAAADLQGGSFTLSNFGSYGGDFETPILNPPQSAMLGIGRIADDVVARDGVPVVRPTMWLSMTYDHRLIDGALAGRFRARLRALLEAPQRLLAVTR